MDDAFGKAASAAMGAGVVALAAAAGTALGDTAGAIVFGSLAEGAKAWLGAIATGNDEARREARIAGLEEQFVALGERLRRVEEQLAAEGKKPDRNDPISREQTFSDFARDVAAARSPEKREALVNAAAAQHDPRRGSEAARSLWYAVVRDTPEFVILLVRMLGQRPLLSLYSNGTVRVGRIHGEIGDKIEVSLDEGLALYEAAVHANEGRAEGPKLIKVHAGDANLLVVALSERGKIVLSYIAG